MPALLPAAPAAGAAAICLPWPHGLLWARAVPHPGSAGPSAAAWCWQDALTVQLVLTFVRNLLAVPDRRATESSGKGDHKSRLRQELLARLLDEHVLELLLIVAQHTDEARFWPSPPQGSGLLGLMIPAEAPSRSHPPGPLLSLSCLSRPGSYPQASTRPA